MMASGTLNRPRVLGIRGSPGFGGRSSLQGRGVEDDVGVGVHPGGLRRQALHFEPTGISVLRCCLGLPLSRLQLSIAPPKRVELQADAAKDEKRQQQDEGEADEAGHQACCPLR
jgi:hypothetical protein